MLINDDIRATQVRMFNEDNAPMGIMPLEQAKTYAYDRGFDLVLIAPQATPPVCRSMDYGKYRYECDKRDKEAKKKQQTIEVKEIQLTYRIDDHDLNIKAQRAQKFLSEGNKVRVSLRFKGREIAHQDIGRQLFKKFEDAIAEYGTIDKRPVLEGRQLTMFFVPVKAK